MIKQITPERFFLVCSLAVGLLLCFIVPIGAGYDEDTHVARIWEISRGNLIPNSLLYSGPNFPSVFYELSYRQKNFLDPVSFHFISDNINRRIDWTNMIQHSTRSLYNPFLYIIQAFIMGIFGRVFDAPVLLIYYLCRISYLLIYVALGYLAIRIIPFGKWLLVVLMLAPMAITQAAVISADPITNSGCFLYLAYVLHLRFSKKVITGRDVWILLGLTALLFTVKITGIIFGLLLFVLPGKKFENKADLRRLILGVIVLFLFLVVGWNVLAFSLKRPFIVEEGVDPMGQVAFIITHPFQFIGIVLHNLVKYSSAFLREWIGVMGYRYWAYPAILYILFPLLLAVAFFFEVRPLINYSFRDRWIFLFAFIVGIFITLTSLYVLLNPVGSDLINRDGRYLVPLIPLVLFAVYPSKQVLFPLFKPVMISGLLALMLVMTLSMFFSYHITCGVNYYTSPGNCYYPVYKNWMPDQRFIDSAEGITHLEQTFISKCSSFDHLRFWVKSNGNAAANYEFELTDLDTKKVLVNKVIQERMNAGNGWTIVTFEPNNDLLSHSLEFRLKPVDKESIPLFAVSTRDEYKSGILKINGNPQDYDVLFQYHCLPNLPQDILYFFK